MAKILTLHSPAQARRHYDAKTWQSETMYGLLVRHAAERGNRFACRDAGTRLTWSQMLIWVDSMASALHQAGLCEGDRVSVWLPSRVESIVVFLACSRNGYICNPSLHQNYTVAEIETLLSRIDCRALIAQMNYGADSDQFDIFERALANPTMRVVFALSGRLGAANSEGATAAAGSGDLPLGVVAFPTLAGLTESTGSWGAKVASTVTPSVEPDTHPNTPPITPPITDPDKLVYLAFTSGTTGPPKGVMHSDNTLLANGRAMVADWSHDDSTVLLSLSPMSHHIGTVALEQTMVCGCELVVHDPRLGRSALDWILETGATYVMGVPTHAMDLLHGLQQRGMNQLGQVRVFYMAGAPIPQETAQRFMAIGVTPQNVYGMTENGSHQYTLPGDPTDVIVKTCGRACHGYEIALWSQENADIPAAPGEIGEIGGRGAVLMLGYFANQQTTERSFNASGWFMSGDLGQIDERGNLHIVGRKKDLIIRGGHNIYPAQIEDLAHRHPAVKKAAAFAVADERLGEKVCLALIVEGPALGAEELLEHLAQSGLSKFDMPEYYLVMDEFPLTPSGKILKRELMAWTQAGRIQPHPVRYKAKSVS
jgi:acyl-CoA synthetase